MIVTRHQSAEEFLALAEPLLMMAEAENNLILGVAQGIARNPSAAPHSYLATVSDGPQLLVCAVHIAPYKIVITRSDRDAIAALARDAFDAIPQVPAVTGPAQSAADFALAWGKLSGIAPIDGMRFRIHEVRTLREQALPSVPGRFRPAMGADQPLLASWLVAFATEARLTEPLDAPRIVADAIGRGRLFVWDDGRPSSMAGWAGKTPNGVRVNLVYTPPEIRRKGYGTACVSAMTAQLLAEGNAFCWLYTALSSQASTTLFRRIGYRAVSEVAEYYLKRDARPPKILSSAKPPGVSGS
jgi:ribosomal protein S18 acetylase RimI-like enzyme